ncbi:hypoxanthine-guanine phosphoribosyltransferase [Methylotenera versatilis]|uniref:hypoxanthine-guanine phosphoribosyltransferase n=1 Tax=Methylotenera versatilis TaxID=1055487 RepID=UPI000647CBF1|nr:hypoxanthine-guanine phosphoribosyltransferase [Methylotenera versatilis]
MTTVDPRLYIQKAEVLYNEQVVDQAISTLAKQLNIDYADESPVVLCVMGGGVFFTGQLLPQLHFSLEFDYVHATRYHGTEGSAVEWLVRPKEKINGRKVLILDDILDAGITLKTIADECRLLGATEIKVAVLVEKKLEVLKPIHADYVGLIVPNRYVFGCGMDVYGWWRNLPAIYAL